ncbi:MAG: DinB family protein [Anaerolineae bacterium]|nr:DinB family protein [Anaerolineae bacterium]
MMNGKRIDPQGWVTARRYNERDLSEMLDRFIAERNQSLEWLRGLASANWDAAYTTPFRTMTAGDMFASWVAHDNLHMRQLVELRRARLVNLTTPYNVEYAGDW